MKDRNNFSIFEKMIYVLILLLAVVGFSYEDIVITSLHGMAFLDAVKTGNFLHFYSFSLPYHEVPPVYDISYYIVFGIWELPLWLLNRFLNCPIPALARIIWCKILLGIFFLAAVRWTMQLVRNFTETKEEADELRLWMLLSPLVLFSIFLTGQYDIIYLSIMLYGFTFLVNKKNLTAAALIFGLAATFKYFSLFAAIPAFLLLEKRKMQLFRCFCIGIVPVAVIKLFPLFDPLPALTAIRSAFFKCMFGRLFSPEFSLGMGKAALFVILYILICFWAYARDVQEENRLKAELLYFPFLALCCLFFCILWHSQWLLLLVPFILFAAAWNRRFKTEIFYASTLLFGGVIVLASAQEPWFKFSPVSTLIRGMSFYPEEMKFSFPTLFNHYELVPILVCSCIAAGLILLVIFAWPGWEKAPVPEGKNLSRLEIWSGFGIVAGIVLVLIALDVWSVKVQRKLFEPESAVLKNYRLSWKKEQEAFTNHLVVNGIHLKQKNFSPPLCLVPRIPGKFRKTASTEYVLPIPSWQGIHAELKAVHLVLSEPLQKILGLKLLGADRKILPAEFSHRLHNQHLILKISPGVVPAGIVLTTGGKAVELSEYYLELEERKGI